MPRLLHFPHQYCLPTISSSTTAHRQTSPSLSYRFHCPNYQTPFSCDSVPHPSYQLESPMSSSPTALPTSSSLANFQAIFHASLNAYKKYTKQDLLAHPLVVQLHNCDSPAAIMTILQEQVQDFEQSRILDQRLTKWLDPTVNVLLAFSNALGEGVSLVRLNKSARFTPRPRSNSYLQVFSPAKVIFAGAGVLLSVSRFLGQ